MAESILFNLAGNIITKLGSLARQELALLWGVPDELNKLKDTVSAIEAVLLDAEEQQSSSCAIKDWISKLEGTFYDIDDLFDELSFETLRRQIMIKDRRKKKQVRLFLSKPNQIAFALKLGRKIKKIRERLEAINTDKTQFHFAERMVDLRDDGLRKARETSSCILEDEVIGRNDEKKAIIHFLLNSNTKEDIAVISIVGMGGLGKTALAQSVYNDNMMVKHFELKLWVCVSKEFDVKIIIQNIIESATKEKPISFHQIDSLQCELKKNIDGRKYFLVMDDVWNENYEKWVTLRRSLMDGAKGSRILITTRSVRVAETFDTSSLYHLKRMDEYSSWLLFKKMAFKVPEEDPENLSLVKIGKEIVAKLKGVPLPIRIIGRLLYNKKSKEFWSSFEDKELYQIMEQRCLEDLRSILELSYNHLPSNLKQCFLYCALFPKDYEIRKNEVIMQWVAQGFIQPNNKDKLIDIAEDYFMELLSRSFFHEVAKDNLGDIITCKMHDLMHDLACSIVENECVHDVNARALNERTRHVSFGLMSWEELEKLPETLSKARNLRTCFLRYNQSFFFGRDTNFNQIFESVFCNLLRLRTLDLWLHIDNQNVQFLRCISKLKHLRYLEIKMSKNTECFLNCITGLYSLEILILRGGRLKELPRDITNWSKLKHLYLYKNKDIEFLPNSISELNNLEKLIVTGYEKVKELPQDIKNLIHLQHLDLQGNSNIEFLPNSITELCELKILILQGCTRLKELPRDIKNWIDLRYLDLSRGGIEFLPDSITQLKNLETLLLRCCGRLKELSRDTKSLINLKHLDMHGCLALTHMPKGLGELTNLRTLNLFVLGKDDNSGGLGELNGLNKVRGSLTIKGLEFCSTSDLQTNAKLLQVKSGFQELVLQWKWDNDSFNEPTIGALDDDYERVLECLQPHSNLREICIKGYKGAKLCNWLSPSSYSFDCLVRMEFSSCKRLQHLPQFDRFPNLKVLRLEDLPRIKHISNNDDPCSSNFFPSLEELTITRMRNLKRWWKKDQTSTKSDQNSVSFPIIFPCLSQLDIFKDCPLLTSVTCHAPLKPLKINDSIEYHTDPYQLDVVSWKSFQSLSYLWLSHISECEFLSKCLRHVTALQQFSIRHCPNLASLPESIGNLTSLTQLKIGFCPDLTSLPELIGNLTSLTQLEIANCPNLTSLPKSMGNLTSLAQLEILSCTRLTSLPEGIRHLHSLQSLTIESCPILEERCKKETGEDWLKVAHIHYVNIS